MRTFSWIFLVGFVAVACAQPAIIDDDAGTVDSGVKPDGGNACPIVIQKRCGTVCTDTTKDTANCGTCGVKCTGNQFCAASKCNDACNSPLKLCGQFCVDLQVDHENCGTCGKGCASVQECKTGACIKKCPLGLTVCDPDCVDLTNDVTHCGDCNTACGMTESCIGSTCCGIGQTVCNGACTNTQYDNNNCGACGFACGGNTPYCAAGKCKSCNPTALMLMDNNTGDQVFINALTAAGIQNTYIKGGVNTYSGNPSAQTFGAVVLMSGSSFTNMTAGGQTAVMTAHNNNVGLVIDEWALYLQSLGYWATLSQGFLYNYSLYGTMTTHTFQLVQAHPIWQGLPNSWSLTFSTYGVYGTAIVNGGTKIANCTTCTNTAGVFVRDVQGNTGRRVHISTPFTYTATNWSSDQNVVKLMINSIRWATGCN